MRNTLPLCAVALALALTPSASSAAPIALNRADWQIVQVSNPNSHLSQALSSTCPEGGTLVASKAAVNERSHSLCKNSGFNCSIPLSCVKFTADGSAVISPISSETLDLTVYGPFGMDPDYKLNRGRYGSGVVIRDAAGKELTYVAPTAPVPEPKVPAPKVPGGKPQPPKPVPVPPKPVPVPPKPKIPPPAPTKPGTHAAVELSPLERGWLMPQERSLYDDSTDAAKKPTAAALEQAYKKARETVAKNLREELKPTYKALVAAGTFNKIDDLLTGKNYSGLEVDLSPDEYKALLTVAKTNTAPTNFPAANAALQYDNERRTIVDDKGKAKLSEHVLAHQIALKFRALLPGAKPGQTPDGAPVMLTQDAFAKIPNAADRDALWKSYQDDWAKADTDNKKRAVNTDYLKKIADKVAAANPPTPPTPPAKPHPTPDFKNTRTLAEFNLLSDAEKTALCSMITPGTGGGLDNCGDILTNADAALAKCNPAEGVKKDTDTLKAQSDCIARVNACKAPATPPAPASTPAPANGGPTDAVKAACVAYNAGGRPDPSQRSNIGAGDVGVDKPLPSEASASTTPPDKFFYTNLGNGLAFGVGGLLLASFFGGPLLMIGVAVAAGIGGYYFSKSVTEPGDGKKKK